MLVKLLLLRMVPILSLAFCKKRNQKKLVVCILLFFYLAGLLIVFWKLLDKEGGTAVFLIIAALFPQYLCYGFIAWMLLRCLFQSWSERVWKRIYGLCVAGTGAGILAETYFNPMILQMVCKILQ